MIKTNMFDFEVDPMMLEDDDLHLHSNASTSCDSANARSRVVRRGSEQIKGKEESEGLHSEEGQESMIWIEWFPFTNHSWLT